MIVKLGLKLFYNQDIRERQLIRLGFNFRSNLKQKIYRARIRCAQLPFHVRSFTFGCMQ